MGDNTQIIVRFTVDGLPAIEQAVPLDQLPKKGTDANDLMAQANAAAEDGKHDDARSIYAKAAKAFPQDANLLNNYAWYLVTAPEKERRPAEAVLLARKAVELTRRQQWHILDTLAEALLLDGNLDEAQKVNDEALTMVKSKGADGTEGLDARKTRITEARTKANAIIP